MKFRSVLVAGIAALFVSQPGWIWAQSSRLDVVKSRGTLLCGVNPSFAGFSLADSAGQWHGFDVDICRAVAAAVFGDAGKVKYIALSAKDRFTALQSGEVDVLARNASWTLTRNRLLSTDPLSPAVRAGDDRWANVVRWSFYAMVQAEDLGLQSTTVGAAISTSQNPSVLRLAGKLEDRRGTRVLARHS